MAWPVFGVFLLFLSIRTLQLGYRLPWLGDARIELMLGIPLSLLALVRLAMHRRACDWTSVAWGVALLVLMGIMSVASVDPAHSLDVFVDHGLKMAMTGLFIIAWVDSPVAVLWMVGTYLLCFLKMAQEGVVGVITGGLVWENQGVPRLHGPTPIYLHPNSFSGTQLATIPYLFNAAKLFPGLIRAVSVAQILGALVVIVASGSRTSYVGLSVWVTRKFLGGKNFVKGFLTIALMVGAAVVLVPSTYIDRFESIFTQKEKEGHSTDARREILSDSITIFLHHPFGVGTSAFPAERMREFGRFQDTHNLYLEVATNLGIQGLIVFSGLVISCWTSLRRTRAQCEALCARLSQAEGQINSDLADKQRAAVVRIMRDASIVGHAAEATTGYLMIRLILGIFGHDLYEPYWWIVVGLTAALSGICNRCHELSAALGFDPPPLKAGPGRARALGSGRPGHGVAG